MIPPAGAFVRGGNVVVPAHVCAVIDDALKDARLRARVDDLLTWTVLSALHAVALSAGETTSSDSGSDSTPSIASQADALGSYLSTAQAAELLGVSQRAVTKAIADGRLRALRPRGRWLIDKHDLTRYRLGGNREQHRC